MLTWVCIALPDSIFELGLTEPEASALYETRHRAKRHSQDRNQSLSDNDLRKGGFRGNGKATLVEPTYTQRRLGGR